jgi:hypothetical protein
MNAGNANIIREIKRTPLLKAAAEATFLYFA